ncbi:MAG: PAS domain S-box protein [Halobacteriota archaeon]|nr:PAS domain S-box protein [Halobacteriota archaeon]
MNEKPRILVVDDENVTRALVKNILGQQNYDILEAESGEDALVTIEDEEIDIILLDIMMPGLNGFEVLEIIKANQKTVNIKVLMLTAMTQVEDRVRAFSSGAADYITKPFKREELISRIETQINLRYAEEDLKRAKEKYEELFEGANEINFTTDPNGFIRTVNRRVEEITGYSRDELRGKNVIEFAPPDFREKFTEFWNRVRKGERPTYELKILDKQEDTIFLIATGRTIEVEGEIYEIQYNAQDVTELKRTEEALQKTKAKFRSFVEGSNDLIYTLSPDWTVTYISPNSHDILGYAAVELIGGSFKSFIHPEDIVVCTEFLNRVFETGEKESGLEYRIRHKDGNWRWHSANCGFIKDKDGNVEEVLAISRDTTERMLADDELRESEDKFKTIFENANDGIFYLDKYGNVFDLNRRVEEIFGYGPEEILGSNFAGLEFLRPKDFSMILEELQEVAKREKPADLMELSARNKSGEEIFIELSIRSVRKGRDVEAILVIVREITERKLAQDEVKEKNDELQMMGEELCKLNDNLEQKVEERTFEIEKLLKHKDEFINQLGHDLKNPLTPLTTMLPIIEEREKDPELKEMLGVIIENTSYMKNLVVKTLKLAKLNSPSSEPDLRDMNLYNEVSSIIEVRQHFFKKSNIEFENKIKEDIIVQADKLEFEELLDNLISNAVKFMPDGGTVTIDSKNGDGFVIVSVKDTGIGMSNGAVGHIFDEFYKVEDSRYDLNSSGLGLSICKRIVERHGGTIWAESAGKGKGTTFSFTLKFGRQYIETTCNV